MSAMRIHFDPRTKILLLLGLNMMLFINHSLLYECMLVVFCSVITVTGGNKKSIWKFLLVYLAAIGISRLLMFRISGTVNAIAAFFTICIRKFLPLLMLGKWIVATTEVGEFIAAMKQMKLPQSVVIPISVIFRYFPTVREEWGAIRNAMKLRGIGLSVEHVLVPLLISAVNISEELSAAAFCRGLDAPGRHTSSCQIGFFRQDGLVLICAVLLTGVGILLGEFGL